MTTLKPAPSFSLRRMVQFAIIASFIWSVFIGSQIYQTSIERAAQPADAAVVLGAAVYRNRPSPVFRERINHAIELYKSNQVEYLIFTGGFGFGDQIAESEAARAYALANGIPAERILIETQSSDTVENLSGALQIIEEMDFDRILVVSDPLHMKRAMSIADDLGLTASASPTTTSRYRSFRSQSIFLLREIYFYSAYLFQRALT